MSVIREATQQNVELLTEEVFIGELILSRNDTEVSQILAAVPTKMLACPRCQAVFNCLKEGTERDVLSIYRVLKFSPSFSTNSELTQWLGRLAENSISGGMIRRRAKQVIEDYRKRESQRIARDLYRGSTVDASEALREFEEAASSLRTEGVTETTVSLPDVMARVLDQLHEGKKRVLPELGIQLLDKWIGGLEPGSMTLVGALTSVGKSAFVQRCAMWMGHKQHRVVMYTCEMTEDQVAERMITMYSRKSRDTLRDQGSWSDEDRRQIVEAANIVGQYPIEVVYTPGWSIERIEQHLIESHARQPVDVVIVDYLQLVHCEEKLNSSEEQIGRVAQKIREAGARIGAATITVVQLNDDGENVRHPTLKSIRGSRAPGQHADQVLFLSREKRTTENKIYFTLAKNRNGQLGNFSMKYTPNTYHFDRSTTELSDEKETPQEPRRYSRGAF